MTNAISINGLTKHYKGVQALTDLSLEVPAGSVYHTSRVKAFTTVGIGPIWTPPHPCADPCGIQLAAMSAERGPSTASI